MGWFEYNIFIVICGMLEVWGGNQGDICQEEILHLFGNSGEGCVAPFWGLWKKGKFVSGVVNVWYVPIKKNWVYLGVNCWVMKEDMVSWCQLKLW